jgi:hypothetical protein
MPGVRHQVRWERARPRGQRSRLTPERTSRAPEHTSRAPEHTSRAPEHTGRAPEDAGRAPEDTGRAPEHTGRAPEDTGRAPEDTGRAPEDTGRAPEDTGRAPEHAGRTLAEGSEPGSSPSGDGARRDEAGPGAQAGLLVAQGRSRAGCRPGSPVDFSATAGSVALPPLPPSSPRRFPGLGVCRGGPARKREVHQLESVEFLFHSIRGWHLVGPSEGDSTLHSVARREVPTCFSPSRGPSSTLVAP